MLLYELCQSHNFLGQHPLRTLAWYHFRRHLGIRGQVRRRFGKHRLGDASIYKEGDWVQVLDHESIQKTLDAQSRLRGLIFLPTQVPYCGGTYRVQKVMRCIVDDQAMFRPVSRTILLEGVLCSGPTRTEGCGRHCPLMFRDEWVKPAAAPVEPLTFTAGNGQYVRVKPAEEIRASLDWQKKRDGLMFMPEMYQYAGKRFRVAGQLPQKWEFGQYVVPMHPIYILEGLQCSGAVLGKKGICDMGCSILWHADWLSHDN